MFSLSSEVRKPCFTLLSSTEYSFILCQQDGKVLVPEQIYKVLLFRGNILCFNLKLNKVTETLSSI